jgi:hypothetical protein
MDSELKCGKYIAALISLEREEKRWNSPMNENRKKMSASLSCLSVTHTIT